jgi:hypothetical protein
MIHDISHRATVLEVEKIVNDRHFLEAVTKHYSPIYAKMMKPWIEDIAGSASINSDLNSTAKAWSEYFRLNAVNTYISFNPNTPLKHGPTAWAMSMREIGMAPFLKAFASLNLKAPTVTKMWKKFVDDTSGDIPRRDRHWDDTIQGERASLLGVDDASTVFDKVRHKFSEVGSAVVAKSDKISAYPTFLGEFIKQIENGVDPGEARDLADFAVRRAHGTTAMFNKPALVRGGGNLNNWFTTLYGFFGTVMQRRIETVWKANDTAKLVGQGQFVKASKMLPGIVADVAVYVAAATFIEEQVTGLTTDDRRGWLNHLVSGTFLGLSSSVLYARDLIKPLLTGHDPGAGLMSGPMHDYAALFRDLEKGGNMMNKANSGKTIGDLLTVLSHSTGMPSRTVAKATQFGIDVARGQTHPTPSQIFTGVTHGTTKLRVER